MSHEGFPTGGKNYFSPRRRILGGSEGQDGGLVQQAKKGKRQVSVVGENAASLSAGNHQAARGRRRQVTPNTPAPTPSSAQVDGSGTTAGVYVYVTVTKDVELRETPRTAA